MLGYNTVYIFNLKERERDFKSERERKKEKRNKERKTEKGREIERGQGRRKER